MPGWAAGADGFKLEKIGDYKHPREGRQVLSALSPDGTKLAFRKEKGTTIEILEPVSGKLLHTLDVGGAAQWMRFSADGKTLAISTADATDMSRDIRTSLWDTEKWGIRATHAHDGVHDGLGLALSPNGRLLAHCQPMFSDPGKLRVWDTTKNVELATFDNIRDYRPMIAFSGNNKLLVVKNDPPELLDLAKKARRTLAKPPRPLSSIEISPDGSRVAYGNVNGGVSMVDVAGDRLLWTQEELGPNRQSITAMAFLRGAKYLVASTADSGLWIFEAGEGKIKSQVAELPYAGTPVLQADNEGKLLMSKGLFPDHTAIFRVTIP